MDVKFFGIFWYKNEGFYYSSDCKPTGSELSAKTDQHKLYYHQLGTSQKNDPVIYGEKASEKHRYVGGNVLEDSRYLFISPRIYTKGNKLFIKDLSKKDSKLITIIDDVKNDTYAIDNRGSKIYLVTNLNAPNQKVVTGDAENPTPENWENFIAETENVLSLSSGANYFFAEYMVDAVSKVLHYNFDGKLISQVK